MNIALIHFRVGETDGVSLEMDKWRAVLESKGHNVCYIAGSQGTSEAHVIPELFYRDPYDASINNACFKGMGDYNVVSIEEAIEKHSHRIQDKLEQLFRDNQIELIIPNNVLCIGRSLHLAMAITRAAMKMGIKVIGHHHDFYWEREFYDNPTSDYVIELLDKYCPPVDIKDMKHVVINTPAQEALMSRKGLSSTVVPNVFDYTMEPWTKDAYNETYVKDIGLGDNQLVFLQATRVTNRKAIELAIDYVAMMDKPEFRDKLTGKELYNGKVFDASTEMVLLLVGLHEGLEGYEDDLIAYAKAKEVHMIVRPDIVSHERTMKDGDKVYALWDAYVYCDIITYPSIYEGWGNQFLEGIFAKKPQVVFEYSVFKTDIKKYNFNYISLGDSYTLKPNGFATIPERHMMEAVEETIEYLTSAERYMKNVDENFEIAKKHLSMEALTDYITKLID